MEPVAWQQTPAATKSDRGPGPSESPLPVMGRGLGLAAHIAARRRRRRRRLVGLGATVMLGSSSG